MISRPIEASDATLLDKSLSVDQYHTGTKPDFFYQLNCVCNVYEDNTGPVLFCRGSKALRLDIQFVNNQDFRRNRAVMLEGFPLLIERAQAAGFTEIIFNSGSPLLRRFCMKRLGFSVSGDELRKII